MDHRFKTGDHVQERGKERVMTVLAYNDRTPDDHPGLDMRPPPRPMVTCVWSERLGDTRGLRDIGRAPSG